MRCIDLWELTKKTVLKTISIYENKMNDLQSIDGPTQALVDDQRVPIRAADARVETQLLQLERDATHCPLGVNVLSHSNESSV